jgi:hypothetical protein
MNRTTLIRRAPTLMGALAISLLLAGCGEDNAGGGAAPGGVATSEAQVATSATPASTDAPISTITPSSAPTTTEWVNPFSDSEIAERLLLDPDEYGPDWQLFQSFKDVVFDAGVAATIQDCKAFVDSVFKSDDAPNAFNWRWFHAPPGLFGAMSQAVIVFPSEAAAQAMFDATVDPAFANTCLPAYREALNVTDDLYCCDPATPFTPALLGELIPTVDTMHADDIAFRSSEEYWEDSTGTRHGPDSIQNATVRVGRTVTIIETLLTDGSGTTVNTEEQFHRAIGSCVDRARHALGGVDHA